MPVISVVIPAYNAEGSISETITSVLQQTFTDFELVIVDDGSTDGTLKVISRFDDSRITVLSYANAGPQKSRNRGLAKATGRYVSFLDADDLWTADKLARQLEALKNEPEAAVAYSWTDIIDENSQWSHAVRRSRKEGDVFEALLLNNFLGSGSNPLIKTAAIRAVGGFDEAILAGQDWDMWLTLAAHYRFVVVPEVHILYRKVSASKSWSSNLRRQEQGLMQVIEKHTHANPAYLAHRKTCIANCYRYLLFECLEKCAPSPSNGLLALTFFCRTILLEQRWWMKRSRLIAVVLVKVALYLMTMPKFRPA